MSSFTLSAGTFPASATVKAYPATNFQSTPPTGAPTGSETASATAGADGSVAFTGLADATSYYAHSLVGSENRYIRFSTGPAVAAGGGLPSGMGYHVFDVAADPDYVPGVGLLIPSGTDLGSTPHVLGSFNLGPGQLLFSSLYLELAVAPDDNVLFYVGWDDDNISTQGCRLGPSATDPTAVHEQQVGFFGEVTASFTGSAGVARWSSAASSPGPASAIEATAKIINTGGSPTTADITIVSARAALLVF